MKAPSESAPARADMSEESAVPDLDAQQQAAEGTAAAEARKHPHSPHGSFWDQLIRVAGDKKINSLSDLINSTAEVEHMIEYGDACL